MRTPESAAFTDALIASASVASRRVSFFLVLRCVVRFLAAMDVSVLETKALQPMRHLTYALIVFLLLYAMPATAAQLQGRVVHVIDGDGLIVLVGEKRVNVRIQDIDAPETGQPYGIASRQSLIAICGGEVATLQPSGKDRDGWTLGRVSCNGTDAGAEQVRRGMAWTFERYAPAGSPLYAVQAEARAARRGLWAQQKPVPPWEWRERKKQGPPVIR